MYLSSYGSCAANASRLSHINIVCNSLVPHLSASVHLFLECPTSAAAPRQMTQKRYITLAVVALLFFQCHMVFSQSTEGSAAAGTEAAATVPTDDIMASMAGSCPLKAEDFAMTDYVPLRTACDASALTGNTFCTSCICGVGTALVMGFDKAGVLINGQKVTDLAAADGQAGAQAVNMLMANCSTILGLQLLESGGLTPAALTALGSCQIDATTLQCDLIPAAQAAQGPAAATPAAAAPAAAPAAPAPTSGAFAAAPKALAAAVVLLAAVFMA